MAAKQGGGWYVEPAWVFPSLPRSRFFEVESSFYAHFTEEELKHQRVSKWW